MVSQRSERLEEYGALNVCQDLPGGVVFLFRFGKAGRSINCDVALHYPFEPFDGALVAFFTNLGQLEGVVLAEDVVDRNVDGEHEDKRVAVVTFGRENGVAVVGVVHVAAHFGDCTVLADFDDGSILFLGVRSEERVEDFAVDGCVVVDWVNELAHV